MQMCGGFIILSDLCGREEQHMSNASLSYFLSDLCGREVCSEWCFNAIHFLSDLCGREGF